MSKFFHGLWRIFTFPFRALWWLVRLPIRAYKSIYLFLTEEPVDNPVSDILVDVFQQPSKVFAEFDHLRKYLFRMVLGLVVGVIICGVYTTKIIDFLSKPIGGINTLQAIDVTESVGVFMRVALMGGFTLALPYIAFELWLFMAPGLHARSRRMGLIGIPFTLIFFLGGMAFSYFLLLPTALPFLLNFMGIHTIPRVSSYVDFVTGLLFWIGLAFEFPLVIYVLTLMGIIKPKPLAKAWRFAIVIIAVMAAAITPTVDPVNMALVMAPMILLYFISIGLSYLAATGRRQKELQE